MTGEEILLGRKCITNFKTVSLAAADQVVFPANPRRIAFGVCPNNNARITVGFGAVASDNTGYTQPVNTTATIVRLSDFGLLLTAEIHAIAAVAGPNNCNFWEVVLNDL